MFHCQQWQEIVCAPRWPVCKKLAPSLKRLEHGSDHSPSTPSWRAQGQIYRYSYLSIFFSATTTTETVVTPPPGSGSTHHNVSAAEGTVTSVPDLKATLIPISAVCGMFILGGAVAWFFRRKFCSYRNKGNKDDMASAHTVVSMDITCCSCC